MKIFFVEMFFFKAVIASCGHNICKGKSWPNGKMSEEVEVNAKSLSIDHYVCVTKTKHSFILYRMESIGKYST